MKQKVQTRWAIVTGSGYISHPSMSFTRREVIKKALLDYADFRQRQSWAVGLTDAQFWRKMKRKRGWLVRRIALRVAR